MTFCIDHALLVGVDPGGGGSTEPLISPLPAEERSFMVHGLHWLKVEFFVYCSKEGQPPQQRSWGDCTQRTLKLLEVLMEPLQMGGRSKHDENMQKNFHHITCLFPANRMQG